MEVPGLRLDLFKDVRGMGDEGGPARAEELVGALRRGVGRPTRDGHDLAVVFFNGQTRGDERSRACPRFDDEHAERHPRDEAVSSREVLGGRGGVGRQFGDDGPMLGVLGEVLEQIGVLRWVAVPEPAPKDGHGVPVRLARGAMGRGIDPPRPARDDRQLRTGEVAREAPRLIEPVRGALSGTDDAHGEAEVGERSTDEEHGRGIGDGAEQVGVFVVGPCHGAPADVPEGLAFVADPRVDGAMVAGELPSAGIPDARDGPELGGLGGAGVARGPESVEESADQDRAEPGCQAKGEEVAALAVIGPVARNLGKFLGIRHDVRITSGVLSWKGCQEIEQYRAERGSLWQLHEGGCSGVVGSEHPRCR